MIIAVVFFSVVVWTLNLFGFKWRCWIFTSNKETSRTGKPFDLKFVFIFIFIFHFSLFLFKLFLPWPSLFFEFYLQQLWLFRWPVKKWLFFRSQKVFFSTVSLTPGDVLVSLVNNDISIAQTIQKKNQNKNQ